MTNQASLEKRKELLSILTGEGIEIGALHRPSDVPHLKVKYVDYRTPDELRLQYPELAPYKLVDVDIIDDAQTLKTVPDKTQDFVLGNHLIEHMSNPISALLNWGRVIKPGGHMFLAVPERDLTIDRERELTPLGHIIEDYESPSAERDFQHYLDFALFVSCRFFNVRPESEFKKFAEELWEMKYSIHYHVWNHHTFRDLINYVSNRFPEWRMNVVASMDPAIDEFIYVLQKQG